MRSTRNLLTCDGKMRRTRKKHDYAALSKRVIATAEGSIGGEYIDVELISSLNPDPG